MKVDRRESLSADSNGHTTALTNAVKVCELMLVPLGDKEQRSAMTVYRAIKVGKPLNVEDLKRKPASRGRKPNPRDEDLARLVNQVSTGPSSQVIPWQYDGKPATARLAANRAIKASGLDVYVSSRGDMPGQLLFSKVQLTGRQRKRP